MGAYGICYVYSWEGPNDGDLTRFGHSELTVHQFCFHVEPSADRKTTFYNLWRKRIVGQYQLTLASPILALSFHIVPYFVRYRILVDIPTRSCKIPSCLQVSLSQIRSWNRPAIFQGEISLISDSQI